MKIDADFEENILPSLIRMFEINEENDKGVLNPVLRLFALDKETKKDNIFIYGPNEKKENVAKHKNPIQNYLTFFENVKQKNDVMLSIFCFTGMYSEDIPSSAITTRSFKDIMKTNRKLGIIVETKKSRKLYFFKYCNDENNKFLGFLKDEEFEKGTPLNFPVTFLYEEDNRL